MSEWRDIASAPKDGRLLGVVDGETRIIAWGKASHIGWETWCYADQGVEDFDPCQPTHWMPLPEPAMEKEGGR